jgi:glutamine cyclotransferase
MNLQHSWILVVSIIMISCNNSDENNNTSGAENQGAPLLPYQIAASYPHESSHFTQGLAFWNNQLLEGTGNYGESKLMVIDIQSGKPQKTIALDKKYFGEGITVLNDTLYQLTWQERTVFLYDVKTLKQIGNFPLNTEGWGITNDGQRLIVSDGSSNLYFYEPSGFRLLTVLGISEGGSPATNLNELEYINGFVYANQWQYPYILKIDISSGQVVSKLDLKEIINRVRAKDPKAEFLNGIAHNPANGKTYVTGKNWPEMYEIVIGE